MAAIAMGAWGSEKPPAEFAVELRHVSKRFGKMEAVRDVSLGIRGHEFFSLLGPSGCGKTTTLRLIAGFVEIGESLEDAVRREVAEETGIKVGTVDYVASQAWPFPAGLMVGFRATAASESIAADGQEIVEARWFTRADLAQRAASGRPLGRKDSIDRLLLQSWLGQA